MIAFVVEKWSEDYDDCLSVEKNFHYLIFQTSKYNYEEFIFYMILLYTNKTQELSHD